MEDQIERLVAHFLDQDEAWLADTGARLDAWAEAGGDPRTLAGVLFSARDLEGRNAGYNGAMAYASSVAELHRLATLYAATGWLHDRQEAGCPRRHLGTVNEHLWHAFRCDPNVPSERQLRRILNGHAMREMSDGLCEE